MLETFPPTLEESSSYLSYLVAKPISMLSVAGRLTSIPIEYLSLSPPPYLVEP